MSALDACVYADPSQLAEGIRQRAPDIAILGGDSSWGFPSDWSGCPLVVMHRDALGPWLNVDLDLPGMARLAVERALKTDKRLGVLLWRHDVATSSDRARE